MRILQNAYISKKRLYLSIFVAEFKKKPEGNKGHKKTDDISTNSSEKTNTHDIKGQLKKLITEIKQEAQMLSFLTVDEKNPLLSKVVSKNLYITCSNITRSALQLGLGNVENWADVKTVDLSKLRRKGSGDKSKKTPYLDVQDMVASEALPLLELSIKLIGKSREVNNLCRDLRKSNDKIDTHLLSPIYFLAMELGSLSDRLKHEK